MRPHYKRSNVLKNVTGKHTPKDYKRIKILKNARKKAHTSKANAKRNISNNIKKGDAILIN